MLNGSHVMHMVVFMVGMFTVGMFVMVTYQSC